jgi:hypothetical protein
MSTVRLGHDMVSQLKEAATASLTQFAGRSGYYRNTANSHLRGKLGEAAVHALLSQGSLAAEAVFLDDSRLNEADVVVHGVSGSDVTLRVEVKSWNEKHWESLGRCVAAGQLPALEKKADVVVWCTTPAVVGEEVDVEIVGWNEVSEIDAAPRRHTGFRGRQVDNYQVDREGVRPIEELLRLLGVT